MEGKSEGVGELIRTLRQERGLTLRGLAERAGVSPGFLSKIENRQSIPSRENLERLCAALEVPPEQFSQLTRRQPRERLIPRGERRLLYDLGGLVRGETIFSREGRWQQEAVTLQGPQGNYVSLCHPWETLYLLSQGEAAVHLEAQEYPLQAGDALLVPAETEHRIEQNTEAACILYALHCAAGDAEPPSLPEAGRADEL